jgi:hypothetical protein
MDDAQRQRFLSLISQAGPSGKMWEAGESMGLDRNDTEALATDLMGAGHLEMVSLDGKLRVTESGEEFMNAAGPASGLAAGASGVDLPTLVSGLRALGAGGLSGAAATDLMADVACLASQMERSKPLDSVVQACLKAVGQALAGSSQPEAQNLAKQAQDFLA